MDLVDEQDRLFPVHAPVLLGLLHHRFHVVFPGYRGVDLPEIRTGGVGDDLGQRGFAGARRAVKNHGADLVRLDRPVQQPVFSNDVLLAHHLVQRPGTQPGRQRTLLFHRIFPHIIK